MSTNPSPQSRVGAWWKPTPDTIAAFLMLDEASRMIASSARRAPADWQARATKTLGERLGTLLKDSARGVLSIATLGLSEIMYSLAKPGDLAANPNLPPLDLVVGPTEAGLLIVDGAVSLTMQAERLATHDFWDRLARLMARGPHLEVVMVDLAPFLLSLPVEVVVQNERILCIVEADVAFQPVALDRALGLLNRSREGLREANLNAGGPSPAVASFATAAGLASTLQRRLAHKVATMAISSSPSAAALRSDAAKLSAAEAEIGQFLIALLEEHGIALRRCNLLIPRSDAENLAIEQRSREIDRLRKDALAAEEKFELARQQALTIERNRIAQELERSRIGEQVVTDELRESTRFRMARMVMLNEQDLAKLTREGFAEQRVSERTQAELDFRHEQMLLREKQAHELEQQLAQAKTGAEVSRIGMQLEREKLQIAALAQEQNLLNLRRLREIEREDEILRGRERAEQEKARFAVAAALTPEQMLAAMADKNPEVARALAAKFSAQGQSAMDQMRIMREMQGEMAAMMRQSLQSNADVARGLVAGMSERERPRFVGVPVPPPAAPVDAPAPAGAATACGGCGSALQPTWKACPFCGKAQAQ